ncbi:MAG: hypothetical protein R3E87_26865 [Burkholderiaceae bacterium]
MTALVFAFGSNMLPVRLQRRTPRARVAGVALAHGYTLRFDKRGRDGSGKCWLAPAAGESTPGVLFAYEGTPDEVAAALAVLDEFEGVGRGYERALLRVEPLDGRSAVDAGCEAFAYMATPDAIVAGLRPYHWYRDLVLAGARHHALPTAHCDLIAATVVDIDSDPNRCIDAACILGGPPDLSIAAGEPDASSVGSRPVASNACVKPASSNADARPASSNADARPVSSNADARPVSSNAGAEPASSNAGAKPVSSNAGAKPVSSNADGLPDPSITCGRPGPSVASGRAGGDDSLSERSRALSR